MKDCKNGKAGAAKQAYDGKPSLLFERSTCCTLKRKERFMNKPAMTMAGGESLIFSICPDGAAKQSVQIQMKRILCATWLALR